MPSLENLRIDPTGQRSFVVPASATVPAVPSRSMPRLADRLISSTDVIEALGFAPAPLDSAALTGTPTAPTPVLSDNSNAVATTSYVLSVIGVLTGQTLNFGSAPPVRTVFGRLGDIVLQNNDVTNALGFTPAALTSPSFSGSPTAPTPALNDGSNRVATTAFVQNLVSGSGGPLYLATVGTGLALSNNVLSASVRSVFGRTGAIGLTSADVTAALAFTPAALASPAFTGSPTAPTPISTNNSTTLATTAFVQGLLASVENNLSIQSLSGGLTLSSGVLSASVSSVFGRTGAVTLTSSDVSTALGFAPAPALSPVLSGRPTAPTPLANDNSNTLATTAFVSGAIAAINIIQTVGTGLTLSNGALSARVSSVFGRSGAIVLTSDDVAGALSFAPAPLSSPTFSGTPTAPTPDVSDNSTTLATTNFVQSAIQQGTQIVSVQALHGLITTPMATRFGRTLSLIDDFGATADGFTDNGDSIAAWIAAVLATGAIGVASSGIYHVAAPVVFDWSSVASTGATFIGSGVGQCVFSSSYTGASSAFYLTNSSVGTCSHGKITGIGFSGSLPGTVMQIGDPDESDTFTGFTLDIAVTNSDTSSSARAVDVHALTHSTVTLDAASGGRGEVMRITQAWNCTFVSRLKSADIGLRLTSDTITGNVFQALDIAGVSTCVVIDSPLAKSNTFVGGRFNWSSGLNAAVAAINASAGSGNRFINCFFASPGSLAASSTGISIDGSIYSTLTAGSLQIAPASGVAASASVSAVGNASLFTSRSDTGNAGILLTSTAATATLTVDSGGTSTAALMFSKLGTNRWGLAGTTTSEVGANAGTDLVLTRYSNSGVALDTPLTIGQSSGLTTLSGLLVIGSASFGAMTSATLAASPSYTSDADAEAGGVPLGGFYRTGSAVQIRTTGLTLSGAVTETGALTDSTGLLIITVNVQETLAAADVAALVPLTATVGETGALTDTTDATVTLIGAITTTLTATDSTSYL